MKDIKKMVNNINEKVFTNSMVNERVIPFSPPNIEECEINKVIEVLKSGWITTGPLTKDFERNIAKYCKNSKAVCLNSATAAMEMTLHVLGLTEDDEVIVPAYTYTATASVVCHVGAKLVIVDSQEDCIEMDYDALEKAITDKTKVIMPVDVAGVMCDYNKIYEIIERKKNLFKPQNEIQALYNRVVLLADAAHSIGAKYNGKISGEVADFTCFSFHAVKNLTTGEGGAVTWKDKAGLNNEELYKKYMLLSLHGQNKDALAKTKAGSWEYDIVEPYYKCNMTDILAAIGFEQLNRYDRILERRHEIVKMYNDGLSNLNVQVLDHLKENSLSSSHLYLVRFVEFNYDQRSKFIELMGERKISCNVHYKPLPLLSAYKNRGFDINDYPNAYHLFENEVTLPLYTSLSDDDVQYVINMTKEVYMVIKNEN